VSKKSIVEATIGRPRILAKQNPSPQGENKPIFYGRTENLRFSVDEQCSPLQASVETEVFDSLKIGQLSRS
jgi:hypothetical protein